jgi:hypothetical protein
VTEYYGLNLRQSQIDFVNVDVTNDSPLVIDPRSFLSLPSVWGHECLASVQGYFQYVIELIKEGSHEKAKYALSELSEPNETHLGYSKGRSRGSGMGEHLAEELWKALSKSSAVSRGLIQELEDTALLVDGIGPDRVSDITTNLIRRQLLDFTREACEYYGIPMEDDVVSGALWNPSRLAWESEFCRRPIADGKPLLLVPKSIARLHLSYSPDEYFNNYVLDYLQEKEVGAGGTLAKVIRSGSAYVTKKSVREKYGVGKPVNRRVSVESPQTLERYRSHKRQHPPTPMDHFQLEPDEDQEATDFEGMLREVLEIPAGPKHADLYHKKVEILLSAIFYPALVNPRREFPLHGGRKRVDIAYTNAASSGFFVWLSSHYPSAYVFIECKNYTRPIGNPEYDQLAGRFSPSRGKFGILMYRGYEDKSSVLEACRNAVADQRGFIIALDDSDLSLLVKERKDPVEPIRFDFLQKKFNEII